MIKRCFEKWKFIFTNKVALRLVKKRHQYLLLHHRHITEEYILSSRKRNMDYETKKSQQITRVWRQAGRCLVGHFAGFWKFGSRPSLSETPPERQAPDTLAAILRTTAKRIKGINIK